MGLVSIKSSIQCMYSLRCTSKYQAADKNPEEIIQSFSMNYDVRCLCFVDALSI